MPRASFGDFGVAMVREVFSPEFLQRQLDSALASLLQGTDWLPDAAAEITSVRARLPTVLEDRDDERSFAVTVVATLEADVGPRLLAVRLDAEVKIDLTVRVRTFRPAIAALDVDPLTTDDVRLDLTAHSDWLPSSLLGSSAAPPQIAEVWERFQPVLANTLNEALARSENQRRVDVLDRVRRWQVAALAPSDEVYTGSLGRGEAREWPLELDEQDRAALHLWAAVDADAQGDKCPVQFAVLDADGAETDACTLEVRQREPVFETTAGGPGLVVTATEPVSHRIRLANQGTAPITYRIQEQRRTIPGRRIGFDEFGSVLIRRGVDATTVSAAVGARLSETAQVVLDAKLLAKGTLATRLLEVDSEDFDRATNEDALRFRLLIELGVELHLGPGQGATVVSSTLQADVRLTVSTMVEPAAIQVAMERVTEQDLTMVSPPRRISGRRIPIPERKLAEMLPERVLAELNARLGGARRRIVASDLAADAPMRFAPSSTALRSRTTFEGTLAVGKARQHTVRLGRRQHVRAKARLVAAPGTDGSGELSVELALCDEHGGVWATDERSVPGDGDPQIVGVEFTAPHAGQWRFRLQPTGGPGEIDYELQIRPDS